MAGKSRFAVSNLVLVVLIALAASAIPIVAYFIIANPLGSASERASVPESDPGSAASDVERIRNGEPWAAASLSASAGTPGASLVLNNLNRTEAAGPTGAESGVLYLAPFCSASRVELDDGLSRVLARMPSQTGPVHVTTMSVSWSQPQNGAAAATWQGPADVELLGGALNVTLFSKVGGPAVFEFHYAKRSGVISLKADGAGRALAPGLYGEGTSILFSAATLDSSRRLTLEQPQLVEGKSGKVWAKAKKLELTSGQRMELDGVAKGIAWAWFQSLDDGVLRLEGLEGDSFGLGLLPWFSSIPLPKESKVRIEEVEFRSSGSTHFRGLNIQTGGIEGTAEEVLVGASGQASGKWTLEKGSFSWASWGLRVEFDQASFVQDPGRGPTLSLDGYSMNLAPGPVAMVSAMGALADVKRLAEEFLRAKPQVPSLVFPSLPDFAVEARKGRWTIPLLGGAAIEGVEFTARARGGVLEEIRLGLCRGGAECSDLGVQLTLATDAGGVLDSASIRLTGALLPKVARKVLPPWITGLGPFTLKADVRKPESKGVYRWSLEASVTGLKGNHPMVSSVDLEFPPISFSAAGRIDLNQQTFESSFEKILFGDALIRASLDVKGFERKPWVRLGLDMPDQDCSLVHKSLPKGLAPRLDGTRFQGYISGNFLFEADFKDVRHTLKMDVGGDFARCDADFGSAFRIDRLNSESYVHHVNVNGEDLGITVGPGTPDWIPLTEIPKIAQQAAYGTEDLAFFQHQGFRLGLIKRAIILWAERGRFVYGGSTISQQLVKNLFLSREKTLARKFEEAIIVWQMEHKVSKDRILELYLNCIEYGPRIWGIVRAAREYFGKTPQELTLLESAFLMGLKPDPAYGYLQYRRGKLNKHWHKNLEHVLKRLREMEAIDDATLETALKEELIFAKPGQPLPAVDVPVEEDRPVREGQEEPEQL